LSARFAESNQSHRWRHADAFATVRTYRRREQCPHHLREPRMPSPKRARVVLLMLLSVAGTGHAGADGDDRYAGLDALIAREPGHIGALHHAARTAANAGDGDRAIAYLRALENHGFDDALEPADFASLAGREDYREIARRLEANSVVGAPALHAETDCLDVLPEGTAYDTTRDRFLMSSGRRRNVIAVDADGRCHELLAPGNDGLLAVLGMDVDAARDTLWVASAAAPFMHDAASAKPGDARLSRIDLASGRVIASYAPAGAGLLNDLDLLPDGRVAVTDSVAGTVYLLDPTDAVPSLQPLLAAGSFEGPNGIVALADGQLVVADFHALWLVDPSAAAPLRKRRLTTAGGRYLGGMDGLARDGDHIVAIQNLVGRGRVWRFRVDAAAAHVDDLHLLLRQHPDLRNPTTGVVVGRRFLFVADPNLQTFANGAVGDAPQGRHGHRILSLPLP
jgi:sugar lactone lactonase YvrE